MLRIYLYDGSHQEDVCDYCRKTGHELICLQIHGRSWRDQQTIMIHTHCLDRQIGKLRVTPPQPVLVPTERKQIV